MPRLAFLGRPVQRLNACSRTARLRAGLSPLKLGAEELRESRGGSSGQRSVSSWAVDLTFSGSPSIVPFLTPFSGEGSPAKIDHRKKGTLILTSLLEDLGLDLVHDWLPPRISKVALVAGG